MRLPSLKFSAVLLTACAIAGLASPSARAEFVAGFTGNSQMSENENFFGPNTGDAGIVSFAVFHNTTANWQTALAAELGQTAASLNVQQFVIGGGGAAIDFGAQYVYMYQAVNIGTANIDALKVLGPTHFTSGGLFLQQVFETTGGKLVLGASGGGAGVLGLGTLTGFDDVTNGLPSATNGVVTGIKDNPIPGSLVWDASQSDLSQGGDATGPPFGPNVTVQWLGQTGGPGQWSPVKAANTSSIVFLTSNLAPAYAEGKVLDGIYSSGDVPVPNPEPGSLVLAGMGIVSLLGYHVRRRKAIAGTVAA